MDSDASSLLILVAIIAAAILVPLVLIGGLVQLCEERLRDLALPFLNRN